MPSNTARTNPTRPRGPSTRMALPPVGSDGRRTSWRQAYDVSATAGLIEEPMLTLSENATEVRRRMYLAMGLGARHTQLLAREQYLQTEALNGSRNGEPQELGSNAESEVNTQQPESPGAAPSGTSVEVDRQGVTQNSSIEADGSVAGSPPASEAGDAVSANAVSNPGIEGSSIEGNPLDLVVGLDESAGQGSTLGAGAATIGGHLGADASEGEALGEYPTFGPTANLFSDDTEDGAIQNAGQEDVPRIDAEGMVRIVVWEGSERLAKWPRRAWQYRVRV